MPAGNQPHRKLVAQIVDVHIKNAKILPDRGGFAHQACRSGEGDIPFARLLTTLLLLGDTPQVRAFACEEENEMYAPADRLPTDPPPGEALQSRLAREKAEAAAQISYVRKSLAEIRATDQAALG